MGFTIVKMKRFIVPVLALTFFVATTPVYAASFNFGDFLNFLRARLITPVSTPSTSFGTMVKETVAPTVTPVQSHFEESVEVQRRGTPATTPVNSRFENQETTRRQNLIATTTPASETRAQKLQALVTRLFNNVQNRIDNYTDFLAKVEGRRDKLFDAGKDVTKLDAFIQTAKTNLAAAQAALNNAQNALENLDYTQNPGTIIKLVREQVKIVREALTALHKSMSETVREILSLSTTSSAETPTVAPTKESPRVVPSQSVIRVHPIGVQKSQGQGGNK